MNSNPPPVPNQVKDLFHSYFGDTLTRYGRTAKGVDWGSAEAQELRFEVLTGVCDGSSAYSVIDYGCGYGALLDHLRGRGWRGSYQGFDVLESMIESAREGYGDDTSATFTANGRELAPADYVIANAIFNQRGQVADPDWKSFVTDTLDHMNALAMRGMAFNILTSYSDPERMREDLYYADPCEYFDHCKRNYSREVALLHDYGAWEFTIFVRKI